ncbi:MAG: glycosyltransferase [Candidatus Coatesbacteria bacterium]|nr:MAG: glycosyltransferase [Candidatus Coatesbacteria bacterium]
MSRVLFISNDYVSKRMAGPAIRCLELSRALSRRHEVILACENEPDIEGEGFSLVAFNRDHERLRSLASRSDVLVLPPYTLSIYPFLKTLGKPLVMDLYDPFVLEKLEVYHGDNVWSQFESDLAVLREQLLVGDFFVAGTDDQRSLWIGMLAALGRINPKTYARDKSLKKLICTVPFGVQSTPPIHTEQVMKGVVKGIDKEDFVLIWAGGIWNWFDPFTLLSAMKVVSEKDSTVKLFFLGVRHPHPAMPREQFRVANEAKSFAKELGLLGRSVFFNHEWVPYKLRQNFLLEADAGVSTHFDHVENTFSIRTRALDYIWAGLPMIMTEGDYISRLAKERKLGLCVPQQDVEALARAIMTLRGAGRDQIDQYKKGLALLAEEFRWDAVARPLDDYCLAPVFAADKPGSSDSGDALQDENPIPGQQGPRPRSFLEKLVHLFKKLLVD